MTVHERRWARFTNIWQVVKECCCLFHFVTSPKVHVLRVQQ